MAFLTAAGSAARYVQPEQPWDGDQPQCRDSGGSWRARRRSAGTPQRSEFHSDVGIPCVSRIEDRVVHDTDWQVQLLGYPLDVRWPSVSCCTKTWPTSSTCDRPSLSPTTCTVVRPR